MLNQIAILRAVVTGWISSRFEDDRGASLVEYALLLALIAVVAITALIFLGHTATNTLNQVANNLNAA
jgi:pilus assembly protein Flp/PilA